MPIGATNRPVQAKGYAGQRLYRPDFMADLTRDDLMATARRGERFVVVDAGTGNDVGTSFYPIMVEL